MECPVRACTLCEHRTGLQGWCRVVQRAREDSATLGPSPHLRMFFFLVARLGPGCSSVRPLPCQQKSIGPQVAHLRFSATIIGSQVGHMWSNTFCHLGISHGHITK